MVKRYTASSNYGRVLEHSQGEFVYFVDYENDIESLKRDRRGSEKPHELKDARIAYLEAEMLWIQELVAGLTGEGAFPMRPALAYEHIGERARTALNRK